MEPTADEVVNIDSKYSFAIVGNCVSPQFRLNLPKMHLKKFCHRRKERENHSGCLLTPNSYLPVVCRLCANLQDNLVPLFEGEGQENNLPDRISKYLDFSVHMARGLPSSVCVDCTMSVLNWHRFYKNCEKVNENFRAMLQSNTVAMLAKETHPEEEIVESCTTEDVDDVVGIDFDEDSSAFNKILKEAEINDLDKAPDDIILAENLIIVAGEPEQVIQTVEVELEPKPATVEQEDQDMISRRKSGRRKLPR